MDTKCRTLTLSRCGCALAMGVIIVVTSGCQTFSLSEEDFQKQQLGMAVDPHVGDAVAVAGTAAYVGAMIGALAAGVR